MICVVCSVLGWINCGAIIGVGGVRRSSTSAISSHVTDPIDHVTDSVDHVTDPVDHVISNVSKLR